MPDSGTAEFALSGTWLKFEPQAMPSTGDTPLSQPHVQGTERRDLHAITSNTADHGKSNCYSLRNVRTVLAWKKAYEPVEVPADIAEHWIKNKYAKPATTEAKKSGGNKTCPKPAEPVKAEIILDGTSYPLCLEPRDNVPCR